MNKLAIVTVAEKNIYERQVRLLCESIFKFLGRSVEYDIFVFSPRVNNKPNSQTKDFFKKHGITHIEKDLNIEFDYFPLANSLFAANYFEKKFPEYKSILLVDSDTVFLNPISPELINTKTVFAKIVDNIGVGSSGKYHKHDEFWKKIFDFFNLELPEPHYFTTVRIEPIRPYFNSGFVLANNIDGFFQQWLADFIELMNSNIKPDYFGRDGTNFGFYEQLALSITLAKFDNNFTLLPETYNYPVPFRPLLKERTNHPKFNELNHIHYHKWFQHPEFLDHVTSDEEKKSEQYLWLKQHLPLKPEIDGPLKC
ncbi:MAG: glycosyltransferase [Marinicellaceae bacterium]